MGHYGKRSADAEPEADAQLLYGGLGYAGYGYSGLGYAGYGYGAYPYNYGDTTYAYGKRSADAEPLCTGLHTPYACGLAAPYTYGLAYASPYIHYGKRSADAEPEAYYGRSYGYGYGYSGYRGY